MGTQYNNTQYRASGIMLSVQFFTARLRVVTLNVVLLKVVAPKKFFKTFFLFLTRKYGEMQQQGGSVIATKTKVPQFD
jgi:hypothetical protein